MQLASVSGISIGSHCGVVVLRNFVRVRFGLLDVFVAMFGVVSVDVGAVARPLNSPVDHLVRRKLEIPGPADSCEILYDLGGPAVVDGQFCSSVVPGEGVVVVVPSFAKSPQTDPLVFSWHDVPENDLGL